EVLSAEGVTAHPGTVGELVVSGPSVARGYLDSDSSSSGFEISDKSAFPRYRTGDLVYQLPDGNYMFAGRKDDQIKIRGYRVEIGDIIKAISFHPSVAAAEVTARRNGDDTHLTAWIVPRNEHDSLSDIEILEFLRVRVPDHMIPDQVRIINQLPRSSG